MTVQLAILLLKLGVAVDLNNHHHHAVVSDKTLRKLICFNRYWNWFIYCPNPCPVEYWPRETLNPGLMWFLCTHTGAAGRLYVFPCDDRWTVADRWWPHRINNEPSDRWAHAHANLEAHSCPAAFAVHVSDNFMMLHLIPLTVHWLAQPVRGKSELGQERERDLVVYSVGMLCYSTSIRQRW